MSNALHFIAARRDVHLSASPESAHARARDGAMHGPWVVEYSALQKAYHVDQLEAAVRANRDTFLRGIATGYQILAIVETYQEAHSFCKILRTARERIHGRGRDEA